MLVKSNYLICLTTSICLGNALENNHSNIADLQEWNPNSDETAAVTSAALTS